MSAKDPVNPGRRQFLQIAAAGVALSSLPLAARIAAGAVLPMKIGVIGSGKIGGTVGALWVT
jgi:8-hydroxy-5-deazaflavin:NADPH oxidoreductase